jgi:hypothetical protein
MQLACGFSDLDAWTYVNPRIVAYATSSGKQLFADSFQGSHLCHNGQANLVFCTDVLCMKWESAEDNQVRETCQKPIPCGPRRPRLAVHLCTRVCDLRLISTHHADFNRLTFPCVPRAHESGATVRKTLRGHFNAIQAERDANGMRLNRIGRCTFQDCKREIVTISRFLDCFRTTIARAVAMHLNSTHRTSLRTAIPVLPTLLIR